MAPEMSGFLQLTLVGIHVYLELIETLKKLCSIHSNGAPLLDENNSRLMNWRVPTSNVQKIELIFKDSPGKPAQIADLTIHYSNL